MIKNDILTVILALIYLELPPATLRDGLRRIVTLAIVMLLLWAYT